jgi:hypothetical protein
MTGAWKRLRHGTRRGLRRAAAAFANSPLGGASFLLPIAFAALLLGQCAGHAEGRPGVAIVSAGWHLALLWMCLAPLLGLYAFIAAVLQELALFALLIIEAVIWRNGSHAGALGWHFVLVLSMLIPVAAARASCTRCRRARAFVRVTGRTTFVQNVLDDNGVVPDKPVFSVTTHSVWGCRYCGARDQRSGRFDLDPETYKGMKKDYQGLSPEARKVVSGLRVFFAIAVVIVAAITNVRTRLVPRSRG